MTNQNDKKSQSQNGNSHTDLYIAIAGVVIGVASFAYTWMTNRAQDAQWLEINRPRFINTSSKAIAWEELDKETAFSRNWGYQPMVFPYSENYLQTSRFRRYTELVLWDDSKKVRIMGNAPAATVEELRSEAVRLQVQQYPDQANVSIRT